MTEQCVMWLSEWAWGGDRAGAVVPDGNFDVVGADVTDDGKFCLEMLESLFLGFLGRKW